MNWKLDDLVEWWGRVYDRTLEVAASVPPNKLDWQPAASEYSCGDIIRHLASAELMNVARLRTGRLSYPGHNEATFGRTKAEAIVYLEQSHAQAVQMLHDEGEMALEKLVPTNQGLIAGWRAMVGMLEHEIHHRSQLCSYLSQMGLKPPPLYGLYVEDLPI